MFYDRARGKRRRVTAWCRFPLRLLTLQQTQRQVASSSPRRTPGRSELLKAVGGGGGDRFALGFFAGEGNTPNSLSRDGVLDRLMDADRRREVRVVDECPYCRERASRSCRPTPRSCGSCTRAAAAASCPCSSSTPRCTATCRRWSERSTSSQTSGSPTGSAHSSATSTASARCTDTGAAASVTSDGRAPAPELPFGPADPLYDACPSLEIVDELHMVDEDLGAFSGHYEGILARRPAAADRESRPDGRGVRMKVVATTATIKRGGPAGRPSLRSALGGSAPPAPRWRSRSTGG